VSELSVLLPLDTLAGMPMALANTPFNNVLLLIIFPAILFALITGATKVSTMRGNKHQQRSDSDYKDPVWHGPEPTGQQAEGQGGQQGSEVGAAAPGGRGEKRGRGGASARW
jgi:hypothetical protein